VVEEANPVVSSPVLESSPVVERDPSPVVESDSSPVPSPVPEGNIVPNYGKFTQHQFVIQVSFTATQNMEKSAGVLRAFAAATVA
jgi:hypothetical protein